MSSVTMSTMFGRVLAVAGDGLASAALSDVETNVMPTHARARRHTWLRRTKENRRTIIGWGMRRWADDTFPLGVRQGDYESPCLSSFRIVILSEAKNPVS